MKNSSKERYLHLFETVRSKKNLALSVVWLGRIVTGVVYLYYPLALLWLILRKDTLWVPFLAVPAVGFAAVSLLRKALNFKRPYEELPITPLYKKETRGKSFPSRHVFSAFVIAAVSFRLNFILGAVFTLLGALLAACRVLSGVHYPKDVFCGAALGLLIGSAVWIF